MKEDAVIWLRKYLLSHGPQPVEKIKAAAFDGGYSRYELKDARLILQIQSNSIVYWPLPKE